MVRPSVDVVARVSRRCRLGFLLDECVSKTFLRIRVCFAKTVNVMCDFVNENIIQIEVVEVIEIAVANVERMRVEKNAIPPIATVAAERTRPAVLLFACPGKQEDGAKSEQLFSWHPFESSFHLDAMAAMDEVWFQRRQRDDSRKLGVGR